MVRVTALVRAFLLIAGVGFLLSALALLALPARDTVSPALDVVFRIARRAHLDPRDAWGSVFLAAGVVALAGARFRRFERPALLTVLGVDVLWALGLTAPVFLNRHANALAGIAWATLASVIAVVAHYSRHRT